MDRYEEPIGQDPLEAGSDALLVEVGEACFVYERQIARQVPGGVEDAPGCTRASRLGSGRALSSVSGQSICNCGRFSIVSSGDLASREAEKACGVVAEDIIQVGCCQPAGFCGFSEGQ